MARSGRKYEYDAALSFAREARGIAKRIFQEARKRGLRLFYDEDRSAYLWGKDEEEFERIYGPKSRYVIVLVSKSYPKSQWTRWEFETALAEAERRKREFILPVRLDNTRLLGLSTGKSYQDLRQGSHKAIKGLVDRLVAKLRQDDDEPAQLARAPRQVIEGDRRTDLLTRDTRHIVGLITASGFPLTLADYERLFPNLEWRKAVRRLRQRKLVRTKEKRLRVSRQVARAFRDDSAEHNDLNRAWVQALEPLRDHVDTGLLLTLHYIRLGRSDEAIDVLSNLADDKHLGAWQELAITLLEKLRDKGLKSRISPDSRAKLHNALGLCYARKGENSKAKECFRRLRRYSKSTGNEWGVGQSYINTGVTVHNTGDERRAEAYYRQAVAHARRTNDTWLLGRALTNLAQTISPRSPDDAEQMIEESITAKRQARDRVGMAVAYLALGNVKAYGEKYREAIKSYRRAARLAASLGASRERALAIHNVANAYFTIGQPDKARKDYAQAFRIAVEEGHEDARMLAADGLARSSYELGNLRDAETYFRMAYTMKLDIGDRRGAMIAMHSVGVCRKQRRRFTEALQSIARALRLARSIGDTEWAATCIVERATAYHKGELSEGAVKRIMKDAAREECRGRYNVAARLWETVAAVAVDLPDAAAIVEKAFGRWLSTLRALPKQHGETVKAWALLYQWRWQSRKYGGALEALRGMQKAAERGSLSLDAIHALDQTGVCLQELGRLEEAVAAHRGALRRARQVRARRETFNSLNNLGEALRKLAKWREAIRELAEAEQLGRSLGEHADAISAAHNGALALWEKGESKDAANLLERCRDESARRHLWYEYVRAWGGLANLAASQGRYRLAERRYKRGIAEAKAHGQLDILPEIALNLAWLLRRAKRLREALRLLKPHEKAFAGRLDAHTYYMALAELYQDAGRWSQAQKCWQAAKTVAEGVGDRQNVALCAAGLAEVLAKLRQPQLADAELQTALQNEDVPAGRGSLMVQRLGLLLDASEEEAAERVFEEARSLSLEHDLKDVYTDIHVMYGDYQWKQGGRWRREAVKAYLVGMLSGLETSFDAWGDLSSHVLTRILFDKPKLGTDQLGELRQFATKWLWGQIGKTGRITRLLLWPFTIAEAALPARNDQKKLERAIRQAVKDEEAYWASDRPSTAGV